MKEDDGSDEPREMTEVEAAEMSERLSKLGLESGASNISQARIIRVAGKLQRFRSMLTAEQFGFFMQMFRKDIAAGKQIEPVLDQLIEGALDGSLFTADNKQRHGYNVVPFQNRQQKRAAARRAKKKSH